jgi:hypothetical protein
LVHEVEEAVQSRVVRTLQRAGYQVETLVRRRKIQICAKCSHAFWPRGGDGVSVYVGDLLVAVPRDRPRYWVMLDVKGTSGRKRPGQKITAAKGLLFFVRSEHEALAIVAEADKELGDQEDV